MTVTLPYDGVLDEWGLWDRIQTDAEAAERYNNGFGSTATGGSGNAFTPTTPSTPATTVPAGTLADRPSIGGTTGQLYFATDMDAGTLYRWDGSEWQQVAPSLGSILRAATHADLDAVYAMARAAASGAPTNAHYVTSQAESGLSAELVLGTAVIMAGTFASLPAASIAGRLYFATDAAGGRWYRDNGASWVQTTKGLSEMIGLSLIAAKGDLIAGTGAGAVSNVTVGSDGKVLTADSGASTGVSWQTPASGVASTASYIYLSQTFR